MFCQTSEQPYCGINCPTPCERVKLNELETAIRKEKIMEQVKYSKEMMQDIIKQFTCIAEVLSAHFYDSGDWIDKNYPFKDSFDQVVSDLQGWKEKTVVDKCSANCANCDPDGSYCYEMMNEADDEADCADCTRFEYEEKEHQFINRYRCPECGEGWEDIWTATCDDDCPLCGERAISPYESEDYEEENTNDDN